MFGKNGGDKYKTIAAWWLQSKVRMAVAIAKSKQEL